MKNTGKEQEKIKDQSNLNLENIFVLNKIGETDLLFLIEKNNENDALLIASKNIKKIIQPLCPEGVLLKVNSGRFHHGDAVSVFIIHDRMIAEEKAEELKNFTSKIDNLLSVFSERPKLTKEGISHASPNKFNKKYGSASYVLCECREYNDEEKESFLKYKSKIEKKLLKKCLKNPSQFDVMKKRL